MSPPFGASDLTVIIPTVTRWPVLRRTLAGLADQTTAGFATLVVVDGDTEPVPDLGGAQVLVVPHGGPAAARNAGLRAVSTPLVLFLGDDMLPTPVLIERHLASHNDDPTPETAVLGHVDWDRSLMANRLTRWLDWSNTQFDYGLITGEEAGFGRFFSCNVSLKRTFITAAGGFDEAFAYYYEDLDCGWRLHRRGMFLRYDRAAAVHHLHPYDWEGVQRRFEGVARGERLMQRKHPDWQPWFKWCIDQSRLEKHRSLLWPAVADWVPHKKVRRRASVAYHQRLAPRFLNAWYAERDREELEIYITAAAPPVGIAADLAEATAATASPIHIAGREALVAQVRPGATVLDYRCGIGTDGMRLIADGYRVVFAEAAGPRADYLRWRLGRLGAVATVHDVGDVPAGFDAAYAFDVDPGHCASTLAALETSAEVIVVTFVGAPDDPGVQALLDHVTAAGLVRYRRTAGDGHVVVYRPRSPSARSRVERVVGARLPGVGVAELARIPAGPAAVLDRIARVVGP